MKRILAASSPARWCIALALSGCGGSLDAEHNLGDTADEISAPAPVSGIADFQGAWVGEAQDPLGPHSGNTPATYHFPSGATQIHFEYVARESLTIAFGEGQPPAPDPAASYPTGFDYEANGLWNSSMLPPVEGYTYNLSALNLQGTGFPTVARISDAAVVNGVLHLAFYPNQSFDPWCKAQTPRATESGYNCVGGGGWGGGAGNCRLAPLDGPIVTSADGDQAIEANVPVDCGKLYLCAAAPQPVCECDQTSCNSATGVASNLFLSREGADLVGVFSNSVFLRDGIGPIALGEVRFHRPAP